MRVSALRRSLRVPPERMLRRKARSDAEPPVAFGKVEKVESSDACKEEARLSKVAIWEADWDTTRSEVAGSGRRKLNQSGDAGTSSLAFEDETAGLSGILVCTRCHGPNQTNEWNFQVQDATDSPGPLSGTRRPSSNLLHLHLYTTSLSTQLLPITREWIYIMGADQKFRSQLIRRPVPN